MGHRHGVYGLDNLNKNALSERWFHHAPFADLASDVVIKNGFEPKRTNN